MMQEDSIAGIYETLKQVRSFILNTLYFVQCALISKSAGGIGVNVHNIRANGSLIAGTNGRSNGLVSVLIVYW